MDDSPHTAVICALSAIELALRLMTGDTDERRRLNIIHHDLDQLSDEI